MALIKCPECGAEISSVAEECPRCGYPIAKLGHAEVETENQKKESAAPLEIAQDGEIDHVIDIDPDLTEMQTSDEDTSEDFQGVDFQSAQNNVQTPKKKSSPKKIGIAVGAVIVMAAVAIFGFVSSNNAAKEELTNDLSGVWYSYWDGEDLTLNFSASKLTYTNDVFSWDNPVLYDEQNYGWEPKSEDTITVGGKDYQIIFEPAKDIMNIYPAITHDAEFETFYRSNAESELLWDVYELQVANSAYYDSTDLCGEVSVTNSGKDSYKRINFGFGLKNEDGEIFDMHYITVDCEDGKLEPGETESYLLKIPKTELNNSSEIDKCNFRLGGQEKVF